MDKDGTLTIKDWYKGMVKSPIMGFGLIQNANVFESKGLTVPNKALQTTSKLADSLPIARAVDVYGNEYWATFSPTGGSVYKNNNPIASLNNIYDIKVYKDYLWVRYGTNLGAFGPLSSGSAQWFPAINSSFSSGYWGQMVVGQDDFLYSTNGNYIAKIEVTASGTPGVAPTLSANLTALDLANDQYATTLIEFGTKILIGTYSPNGGGRIYPWNRQLGTLGNPGLADLPIIFNENGVWQMYSHANKLYVTAGKNGNVYMADGTNYRKLATIPFRTTDTFNRIFVSYYPNAIGVSERGNLLVGNVSSNTVNDCGVWEITDSGEVSLAYTLQTGKVSNTNIGIGFISMNLSDSNLSVGWFNGTYDGIDETTGSYARTTIESPMYRVGSYNKKKTFQHIQWSTVDTLSTGQSITISYRRNKNDSWVQVGSWTFATLGAISSFEDIAGIQDLETVQFLIETVRNVNLIDITLR